MIYNQKEFIRLVAEESDYYQVAIKDVLDDIQSALERLMSESTADEQVSVKLFEGLTLGTKYYPAKKDVMNPRTGEIISSEEHIYPFARYTQGYRRKIRDLCNVENDEE